jgi:hypothetical protein
MESAIGTAFNDTLIGASGNNTLTGGSGNDLIFPGGGIDAVDGGAGSDTISYAGVNVGVSVSLTAGTALISGQTSTVTWMEHIIGTDFNDSLTGDGNANSITGGDGDDLLIGLGGNDSLLGGAGSDTVSYAAAPAGVTVNLVAGSAADGYGTNDTLGGIEHVIGSAQSDTLTGDDFDNQLIGNDGNDILTGNGGNDNLSGGDGDDVQNGGEGDDILNGGAGADALSGGAGNDTLNGGTGIDQIFGEAGDDQIIWADGDGDDLIEGGVGVDELTVSGTTGADTVIIDEAAGATPAFPVIGYWKLDESGWNGTAGEVIDGIDPAGAFPVHNGVAVNGATTTAGLLGNAGDFDGINDYVSLTGTNAITNGGGQSVFANSFSIGVSINPDNISAIQFITGKSVGVGNSTSFGIFNYLGFIYFYYGTKLVTAGTLKLETGTTANNHNGWYNLVAVYDKNAAKIKLYVNGTLKGTTTGVSAIAENNQAITIGGYLNATNVLQRPFNGQIDQVQYFDRALTDDEITVLGEIAFGTFADTDPRVQVTMNSTQNVIFKEIESLSVSSGAGNDTVNVISDLFEIGLAYVGIDLGMGDDVLKGAAAEIPLLVTGGAGNDTLLSGAGHDLLNFTPAAIGVMVDMTLSTVADGQGGTDSFSGFEGAIGSAYNDVFKGNADANTFRGMGGDDYFYTDGGLDIYDGGMGVDTIDYTAAPSGIVVDLSAGTVSADGYGAQDSVTTLENVIGSDYLDTIIGNAANNRIEGNQGDDVLSGGAGADLFSWEVGDGNDVLDGGDGTEGFSRDK